MFYYFLDEENESTAFNRLGTKDLKAKFSNPIFKDGYLYGLSENLLVCLEAKTGKLMWREKVQLR